MYRIRPIRSVDLDPFIQFAQSARIGITSMSKNPDLLRARVEQSLVSFAQEEVPFPSREQYLFVLENSENAQLGGVAGIVAQSARDFPELLYRIESCSLLHFHPQVSKELRLLHPFELRNGPTEIGSLFLSRDLRKGGLGRLLSLSRFLFMACFPQRFSATIMALMRGYFDDQDRSPFWEGVGRKFLDIDFQALLRLREKGDSLFIPIMPRYPLYANILPEDVQAAIGQIHVNTAPALSLLQREGFDYTQEVDFFDAGPCIAAPKASIRTIRESLPATVEALFSTDEEPSYLVCNTSLDFRAVYTSLHPTGPDTIHLEAKAAKALEIQPGDRIRYVAAK